MSSNPDLTTPKKHISQQKREIGQHPCWPDLLYKLSRFTSQACEEFDSKHNQCLDQLLPEINRIESFRCLHTEGRLDYWNDVSNVSEYAERKSACEVVTLDLVAKQVKRSQIKAKMLQNFMTANANTGVARENMKIQGWQEIDDEIESHDRILESTRMDENQRSDTSQREKTSEIVGPTTEFHRLYHDESLNEFERGRLNQSLNNQPLLEESVNLNDSETMNNGQGMPEDEQEILPNLGEIQPDELLNLLKSAKIQLDRQQKEHRAKIVSLESDAALKLGKANETAENLREEAKANVRKANFIRQQLEEVKGETSANLAGNAERMAEMERKWREAETKVAQVSDQNDWLKNQAESARNAEKMNSSNNNFSSSSKTLNSNLPKSPNPSTNTFSNVQNNHTNPIQNKLKINQSKLGNNQLARGLNDQRMNTTAEFLHNLKDNTPKKSQNGGENFNKSRLDISEINQNENGQFRNQSGYSHGNFATGGNRNTWKNESFGIEKSNVDYAARFSGKPAVPKEDINGSGFALNQTWNPQGNLKGLTFEKSPLLIDERTIQQACKFAEFEQNKLMRTWHKDSTWGKLKEDIKEKVEKFSNSEGTMWSWLNHSVKPYLQNKSITEFTKAALLPYLFQPSEEKKLQKTLNYILTPFLAAEREWTFIHSSLADDKKLLMTDVYDATSGITFEERVEELDLVRFSDSLLFGELFYALTQLVCPDEEIINTKSTWVATGREPLTTLLEECIFRVLMSENSGTNKRLTNVVNQSNLKKAFELLLKHLHELNDAESRIIINRLLQSDKFPFLYAESFEFSTNDYSVSSVGRELNIVWAQSRKHVALGFGKAEPINYLQEETKKLGQNEKRVVRFEGKGSRNEENGKKFDERKSYQKFDKRKGWQALTTMMTELMKVDRESEFVAFIGQNTGDAEEEDKADLGQEILQGIVFALIENTLYDGVSEIREVLESALNKSVFSNMQQHFKLLTIEASFNRSKIQIEMLADTCSSCNMIRSEALYELNLYDLVQRGAEETRIGTAGGSVVLKDVIFLDVSMGALDCGRQKFYVVNRTVLRDVRGILGIPCLQICGLIPHIKTWFKSAIKGSKVLEVEKINENQNENNVFTLNKNSKLPVKDKAENTAETRKMSSSVILAIFLAASTIFAIFLAIYDYPPTKNQQQIYNLYPTTNHNNPTNEYNSSEIHPKYKEIEVRRTGENVGILMLIANSVILMLTIGRKFLKITSGKKTKEANSGLFLNAEIGSTTKNSKLEVENEKTEEKSKKRKQFEYETEQNLKKTSLNEEIGKKDEETIEMSDIIKFDKMFDDRCEENNEIQNFSKTVQFENDSSPPLQVNYFQFKSKILSKKNQKKFESSLKKYPVDIVEKNGINTKRKRVWDERAKKLSERLNENVKGSDVFVKLAEQAAYSAETFACKPTQEERERTDIQCLYANVSVCNYIDFTKFNSMIADGSIKKCFKMTFEEIKETLKNFKWNKDDQPIREVLNEKAPAKVELKSLREYTVESFGFKFVDIYFPKGTEYGLKFVTTETIPIKGVHHQLEAPARAITTADSIKNQILILNNGPADVVIPKNTSIVYAKLTESICTSRFDDQEFLRPRQNISEFKLAELLGQLEIIYENPFFKEVDLSQLEESAQKRYLELSKQVRKQKKESGAEKVEKIENERFSSRMKLAEVNFDELLKIEEEEDAKLIETQKTAECHVVTPETESERIEKEEKIMCEKLIEMASSNAEVIKKNAPVRLGEKLLSQNNLNQIKTLPEKDRIKLLEKLEEFSQERIDEFLNKIEEIRQKLVKKGWPFERFISILIENCDRFAGDEVSNWKLIKIPENLLQIPIQDNPPQRIQPNYTKKPTALEMETLNDFVAQNLCRGLIKHSNSNFINPVLLVKKPNNRGFRVCLDFRKMNEKVFDSSSHSIPLIIEMILSMGNSELFSAFDISSAYYRVRLPNQIRKYTGFSIPTGPFTGQYEFTVLPFGIKSAVSVFSQIMDYALKGLQYKSLLWYLDDCLLHTMCKIAELSGKARELSNLNSHCDDFEIFLKRSRKFNINYSIEKASFLEECTEFLGFLIGQGVLIPASKIMNKIADVQLICKVEKSKRNWLRVLGFYNYLAKYIPRFAHQRKLVCKYIDKFAEYAALTRSIKKRNAMRTVLQFEIDKIICHWNNCIRKTRLVIPKAGTPLTLFTDASGYNIGYVLLDEEDKIIEFGSRVLSETEMKYIIEEKEVLGVSEAIMKTRCYGARASMVHVKMDNKNNVRSIMTHSTPPSSTRSERLLNKLKLYGEINVTYVSTEKNIADFLTRDCTDLNNSTFEALKELEKRITEEMQQVKENESVERTAKVEREIIEKGLEKEQVEIVKVESKIIVKEEPKMSTYLTLCDQNENKKQSISIENVSENSKLFFQTKIEEVNVLNAFNQELNSSDNTELSDYERLFFHEEDRARLKTKNEITATLKNEEYEDWIKIEEIMEVIPEKTNAIENMLKPNSRESKEKYELFNKMVAEIVTSDGSPSEKTQHQCFTLNESSEIIRSWTGNARLSKEELNEIIIRPGEITNEQKIAIIRNFHCGLFHMKAEKLLKQLMIMLPNIPFSIRKIREIIEKCEVCASERKLGATSSCGRIEIPTMPYQSCAIDHYQFMSYNDGIYKYILSVKCLFSKHVVLCVVRTKTMLEVCVTLDQIFSLTGKPNSIRLDNAFKTAELIKWSIKRDILLLFTPPYRPEANGSVERVHRDLNVLVPKICRAWGLNLKDWWKVIPEVARIINQSAHSSTGYPPELVWRGFLCDEFHLVTQNDRISLLDLWDKVRKNLMKKQEERVNSPNFNSKLVLKEGSKVYVKLRHKSLEVATVMFDWGSTAYIERTKFPVGHRFRYMVLHKDLLREKIETETGRSAEETLRETQMYTYFNKQR